MQLSTVYTERIQEEAEQRGEQRGIAITQRRLIRNLLSKGTTIEEIAELTELFPAEVTQLMNHNQ